MSASSGSSSEAPCCNVFNFRKKDLIKSGFYCNRLFDNIVCCGCGWQSGNTSLSLKHINFLHKLENPKCAMSKNVNQDVDNYVNYKMYVCEIEEMMRETFNTWPKTQPAPNTLVEAGFYYIGAADATACISCGVVLENWSETDDPKIEHKKANPSCELCEL